MTKEILAGTGVALLLFLGFSGYNVLPFVFIIGMLAVLLFLLPNRGLIGSQNQTAVSGDDCKVFFQDVGGQDAAKQELIEALNFLLKSEKIEKLGIRPLKGILLTGPPGTGKTMLAKAAAAYTDAIFLAASGSEFVEMYAGIGAQRVRNLFKSAVNAAKKANKERAVIFIDELEVLGGKRGSHSGHLEYDQTLNQLLVELDGLKPKEDVQLLVLGATNRADMLDPALLRPGRFDRLVKVDFPDKNGRLQILKLHTSNKPVAADVDLKQLAKDTFGFSGAHLESVCNEAAILALRDNSIKIGQSHFQEAVDKVMLGEKLDRKPGEKERYRIAVHEVGHAMISEFVRKGSVSLLTISARGDALGYTRQTPEDDAYLYTRQDLDRQIKVTMGGAAAEEVVFGDKSTGATGDFREAVRLAKMVINSGLSSLGVVSEEDLSSQEKQEAVQKLLKEQEELVLQMLQENKGLIEIIAVRLLEEERIEGRDFRLYLTEVADAT